MPNATPPLAPAALRAALTTGALAAAAAPHLPHALGGDGDFASLAAALAAPGASGVRVPRGVIDAHVLAAIPTRAELAALGAIPGAMAYIQWVTQFGQLDASDPTLHAEMRGIFEQDPALAVTRDASDRPVWTTDGAPQSLEERVLRAITRPVTVAEEALGLGVTITPADLGAAFGVFRAVQADGSFTEEALA